MVELNLIMYFVMSHTLVTDKYPPPPPPVNLVPIITIMHYKKHLIIKRFYVEPPEEPCIC